MKYLRSHEITLQSSGIKFDLFTQQGQVKVIILTFNNKYQVVKLLERIKKTLAFDFLSS